MRKAKLHELRLPSKYALWFKYIHGTELQTKIGPENFAKLLESRRAIELVSLKGWIKCKTLNETEIRNVLSDLYSIPYQSFLSVYFSRLVQRLKRNKGHTTL